MLKKILFTAALFTSTTAMAGDILPFLGIEAGGDSGSMHLTDVSGAKYNYSSSGMLGGFFGGFGGDINNVVRLNLEAFVDWATDTTSSKTINVAGGTSPAKIKANYTYGLSLVPGFNFGQNGMLYLRAGIIRTRFTLNQNILPVTATSTNDSNTRTGAEVGIGLQGNLSSEWAIRGEYDYASYRSFNSFGNNVSVRNNIYKVGVLYNFC